MPISQFNMSIVADRILDRREYEISRRRFSGLHILLVLFLIPIITLAFVLAFEFACSKLLNSRFFTLNEIAVYGNRQINTSDIIDATGLRSYLGNNSVYSIMPHIIEKRVKSSFRYLEMVKVERKIERGGVKGLYGLLTITVKEREPMAFVASKRDASSFIVVDAGGFILEELKGDMRFSAPYVNMPIILGVDVANFKSSGIPDSSINIALDVVLNAHTLVPGFLIEISYIDARKPDEVMLYLQNQPLSELTVRMASDRIKDGLKDLVPVIMKLRQEKKEVKYIDARFEGAVYCMGL
jgi:hypothetical protein